LISEPGRYLLKEQQFWQAECIGRDCCLQSWAMKMWVKISECTRFRMVYKAWSS
jgi:hypothetical protein